MTSVTQQIDADDDEYAALEIPARDAGKFGVDVRPPSESDEPEQSASELKGGDHHG